MDSSAITSMNDTQLDTMLDSGSVHTTIDNMMRGNTNINSEIPALAEYDAAYKLAILTKVEIKVVGAGNFTSVSFDVALLAGLSPTDQAIVADSMIVRNILTPSLEVVAAVNFYVVLNSDYELSDPLTFLTKTAVLYIVNLG